MTRLRPFWPVVIIAVAGILASLAWQLAVGPAPILFMRVDVATLLMLLAFLIALVWLVAAIISTRAARGTAQAVEQARLAEMEAHRRFIRRLDHELKNPLTAIRAGLANLPASGNGTVVPGVRAQVDRLAHLSADLRKLADLETLPLEREPVDLGALLNELVNEARADPENSYRQFRLTLPQAPWPLPPVPGDRDLLFLAIHNLLDNAIKYSRPGDTIELRAFEDGNSAAVEIADTGTGISPEELPQVWDELYRGQKARSIPGSGLGLALVRAIVERHSGQASVRSRPGQGTVFTLRLPLR